MMMDDEHERDIWIELGAYSLPEAAELIAGRLPSTGKGISSTVPTASEALLLAAESKGDIERKECAGLGLRFFYKDLKTWLETTKMRPAFFFSKTETAPPIANSVSFSSTFDLSDPPLLFSSFQLAVYVCGQIADEAVLRESEFCEHVAKGRDPALSMSKAAFKLHRTLTAMVNDIAEELEHGALEGELVSDERQRAPITGYNSLHSKADVFAWLKFRARLEDEYPQYQDSKPMNYDSGWLGNIETAEGAAASPATVKAPIVETNGPRSTEKYVPPIKLPYYTPLEAAIRWCGYMADEYEIIETYELEDFDFSQWPHLTYALTRIEEGVQENQVRTDFHIGIPRGRIEHQELKEWFAGFWPGQRPDFLFDDDESDDSSTTEDDHAHFRQKILDLEQRIQEQTTRSVSREVFDALQRKYEALEAAHAESFQQVSILQLENQKLTTAVAESPASQWKSARTIAENSLLKIVSALCNDSGGLDLGTSSDVSEIVQLCEANGYELDTGTVKKWRDEMLRRFPPRSYLSQSS